MGTHAARTVPEPRSVCESELHDGSARPLRRHGSLDAGTRLMPGYGNGPAIDLYCPFRSLLAEEFDPGSLIWETMAETLSVLAGTTTSRTCSPTTISCPGLLTGSGTPGRPLACFIPCQHWHPCCRRPAGTRHWCCSIRRTATRLRAEPGSTRLPNASPENHENAAAGFCRRRSSPTSSAPCRLSSRNFPGSGSRWRRRHCVDAPAAKWNCAAHENSRRRLSTACGAAHPSSTWQRYHVRQGQLALTLPCRISTCRSSIFTTFRPWTTTLFPKTPIGSDLNSRLSASHVCATFSSNSGSPSPRPDCARSTA